MHQMLILHPPAFFFISAGAAAAAGSSSLPLSFPAFIHRTKINSTQNKIHCFNSKQQLQLVSSDRLSKSDVISDTIRLLEWPQLCDHVSSFAGTPLGREAAKSKLLSMSLSYEESKRLLDETTAAIELIDYGAGLDFAGVDVDMVKLGIERVSRGYTIDGLEAIAVVGLIQLAQTLQSSLQSAIKADEDNYIRFLPLSEMIMDAIISQPLVKSIQQVIDDDGSVKDSASPDLRRYRDQVRTIDRKLSQVMDKLTREHANQGSSMEVCSVNGRWCMKITGDEIASLEGLLMSSRSSGGSYIEPIVSVQLNDQLQEARVLVAKAEEDVLSKLSDKMLVELDHIQSLLQTIIQLDTITARAKYSIAYDGTIPELYQPDVLDMKGSNNSRNKALNKNSITEPPRKEWKLYIPKAYHPLLLKKHRENLNNAKKDVANAIADMRRLRMQGNTFANHDDADVKLASLKLKVATLEKDSPVPVDFVVSTETTVLVITGPNTGGKTISLKTVGMASLMAKAGLYVIASEPVRIPWFDAVFADIGDEQSLTQSLSTFSGHIRQINAIRSRSTSKSLVLLDEIGAGTNPLEGAALGMSLLESFAEYGSFLTVATTHHGELKTLKYSNKAFENACVEFDEDSLKPTYKILWGIPGRSNAINVAERLGLPGSILDNARRLYGTSGAEINQVIIDMESSKQDLQQSLQASEYYLMLSRKLHDDLLTAKKNIEEYSAIQKNKKREAILHSTAIARSILRKRMQQFRESLAVQKTQQLISKTDKIVHSNDTSNKLPLDSTEKIAPSSKINYSFGKQTLIPKIGDTVMITSIGKQAQVLKVDVSKGEVTVLASNMTLRLKLNDVNVQGRIS